MQDLQIGLQTVLDAGAESYELQHWLNEGYQSEVVHAFEQ